MIQVHIQNLILIQDIKHHIKKHYDIQILSLKIIQKGSKRKKWKTRYKSSTYLLNYVNVHSITLRFDM